MKKRMDKIDVRTRRITQKDCDCIAEHLCRACVSSDEVDPCSGKEVAKTLYNLGIPVEEGK